MWRFYIACIFFSVNFSRLFRYQDPYSNRGRTGLVKEVTHLLQEIWIVKVNLIRLLHMRNRAQTINEAHGVLKPLKLWTPQKESQSSCHFYVTRNVMRSVSYTDHVMLWGVNNPMFSRADQGSFWSVPWHRCPGVPTVLFFSFMSPSSCPGEKLLCDGSRARR